MLFIDSGLVFLLDKTCAKLSMRLYLTLMSRMFHSYNFSRCLNLRLYYNQNVSKYAASTAFPLSDIRFGLAARFSFGN